jgi:hypothetical protein
MKVDKYIKKALNYLKLEWNNKDFPCTDIQSIQRFISYQETLRQDQLNLIETANRNLEIIAGNIENAQSIINRAAIEKILSENPKAVNAYII